MPLQITPAPECSGGAGRNRSDPQLRRRSLGLDYTSQEKLTARPWEPLPDRKMEFPEPTSKPGVGTKEMDESASPSRCQVPVPPPPSFPLPSDLFPGSPEPLIRKQPSERYHQWPLGFFVQKKAEFDSSPLPLPISNLFSW